MKHGIIFITANGPYLVYVCVGKHVDVEYEIQERARYETFLDENDVKTFMDKYIESVKRPDYYPNWYFESTIVVSN